jgi:hypothetical protein
MTAALIVGLSAVALYLWKRLASAQAEVSDLLQQNARLRRRLGRGAG